MSKPFITIPLNRMFGNIIEIDIDEAKLKQIEIMLRGIPNAMPQVMSRGINRTASPAKTEIAKEIREEINIKAGDIKEKIKLDKATYSKWSAEISLNHGLIPIMDFGARMTAKGVSFKVYKSGGRKFMAHAFIAKMSSGHEGVFRKALTPFKEIKWERRKVNRLILKSKKDSPVNWHNVYIGEQFGPSIHQAFEKAPNLVQRITLQASQMLEHNIDAQLEYVLSRKAAA